MSFSERFNYLKTKSNLDQKIIAIESGVSEGAISSWLNEAKCPKNPNKRSVKAVAELFSIEFDWLYSGIGDPPVNLDIKEKSEGKLNKYETGHGLKIIEEKNECLKCGELKFRIKFLEEELIKRDNEIARLNQQIGRLTKENNMGNGQAC